MKYGNTSAKAKQKAARRAAAAAEVAAGPRQYNAAKVAVMLQRPVLNCLTCGRIYDARVGRSDSLALIRARGVCSFCGEVINSLRTQLEELGVSAREENAGSSAAVLSAQQEGIPSRRNAGGPEAAQGGGQAGVSAGGDRS